VVTVPPTDEIYDRYLRKAIAEVNALWTELQQAGGGTATPVVGTGHPLGSLFLLKYRPLPAEIQEGVAFYGRAGEAIIKALRRLHVDPLEVYGTNCLKFGTEPEEQAAPWLERELHIVQPKLVVVMGADALRFLNALDFPLSRSLEDATGELQHFTPTTEALVVPDIDASLDEQPAKTAFWNAFKELGPWWAELPPY
jgi:uracil-DNA glycosylase family 4